MLLKCVNPTKNTLTKRREYKGKLVYFRDSYPHGHYIPANTLSKATHFQCPDNNGRLKTYKLSRFIKHI